jgi:glycosyltransferase involved in cell wall biosynthesis
MSALKISVVMPTFNQASFIEEAVESILNQSYTNFELIIMDGKSTDDTMKKLEKYQGHPNVSRIISQKDKGQADALSQGFTFCTGEIYAWLNSDDVYAKDIFQEVADLFTQFPETDVLNGELNVINEQSEWIALWPRRKMTNRQWLHYPQTIGQPSTFFSSRIYHKVGGVNAAYQYAMDYDLFLRFALADAVFRYSDNAYANFRAHGQSKTMSLPYKFWREEIKVFYEQSNKKWFSGFYYWKFRGILSTIIKGKLLKSRKF